MIGDIIVILELTVKKKDNFRKKSGGRDRICDRFSLESSGLMDLELGKAWIFEW